MIPLNIGIRAELMKLNHDMTVSPESAEGSGKRRRMGNRKDIARGLDAIGYLEANWRLDLRVASGGCADIP